MLGYGEGDSKVPVDALNGNSSTPSSYLLRKPTFRNLLVTSKTFHSVISFVNSFVADALTSVGHLSFNVHMRWQNLPVEARLTWFWDFYRHAQLSPVT